MWAGLGEHILDLRGENPTESGNTLGLCGDLLWSIPGKPDEGQVILLHGPVTLPQSQELLALPLDQTTRDMSCSEVCDKLIPRDLSIALVLHVGRVPTPCGTLELERRERDVVLWPD